MKPPKQKYGLGHPPCLLMSPVSSKEHFTAFVSCILSCLESATKKKWQLIWFLIALVLTLSPYIRASLVAQTVKNLPAIQETCV